MRRERETLSGSDERAAARKEKMIRWIVSRGGFDWIIDGNEGTSDLLGNFSSLQTYLSSFFTF